jgi:serine phosphatase RsbU (regulator of sigma subunit)/anti-anti-sigma regulatory factor
MQVTEGATALLVDDDPSLRQLVRRALSGLGCSEVLEAADGLDAQALLAERPDVDIVITDLMMPRLDGLGLLRWARDHCPEPVWVILSGLDTFDAAVEAIRIGAFDFLPKPPRAKELEVALRNALDHRRLVRDRQRLYTELEEANRQLATKVGELEEKSELLRRDLERAEVIQRALLPRAAPHIEHFSVHAIYRPGRHVGGDLYDVVRLDDRHMAVYVADATGHGVSAAMLSVLFKQRLVMVDEHSRRPLSAGEVLSAVNASIGSDGVAPGLFLTAAYCLIDTVNGNVTIASAGHPPLVLARLDGETRLVRRTGPALGLTPEARFTEEHLRLAPGDRILLYTDGLLQRHDTVGERERVVRLLTTQVQDSEALLRSLLEGAVGDATEEDRDDVTLLLIEAREGSSHFDNGDSSSVHSGRRAAPAARAPVVFYGETDDANCFAIRGRGTWTQCDTFHEVACGMLAAGRRLVLEMSACEYLDSTFLGTIHELVSRCEEQGRGSLHLASVPLRIREMFEELDMERVLAHVDSNGLFEPPEMHPLTAAMGDEARLRVLRAHEALAALSARNREKFLAVVETLRKEMERA